MKNIIFFIVLFALLLVSCESQKKTIWSAEQEEQDQTTENTITIDNLKTGQDLTSQLRGVAGLRVRGEGPYAEITIRGESSFGLSNEPLFVVDGRQFIGDYATLYSITAVDQIKSITVLKDAASLGFYGASAANGVIEIRMK